MLTETQYVPWRQRGGMPNLQVAILYVPVRGEGCALWEPHDLRVGPRTGCDRVFEHLQRAQLIRIKQAVSLDSTA